MAVTTRQGGHGHGRPSQSRQKVTGAGYRFEISQAWRSRWPWSLSRSMRFMLLLWIHIRVFKRFKGARARSRACAKHPSDVHSVEQCSTLSCRKPRGTTEGLASISTVTTPPRAGPVNRPAWAEAWVIPGPAAPQQEGNRCAIAVASARFKTQSSLEKAAMGKEVKAEKT